MRDGRVLVIIKDEMTIVEYQGQQGIVVGSSRKFEGEYLTSIQELEKGRFIAMLDDCIVTFQIDNHGKISDFIKLLKI